MRPNHAPATLVSFLTLALATSAIALPVGLYPLESLPTTSSNPRPNFAWTAISSDGSRAVGYLEDTAVSWSIDEGVMPVFPDLEGSTKVLDLSADGRLLLGSHAPASGEPEYTFIQDANDSRSRIDLGAPGEPPPSVAFLSANGRHAVGTHADLGVRIQGPAQRFYTWRWSEDVGAAELAESTQSYPRGSDAVDVANDGTVFGHGYIPDTRWPVEGRPAIRNGATRWAPGQAPQLIEGVDGEGRQWRLLELADITQDGVHQLGVGLRDLLDEAGNRLGLSPFWAVVRDDEIDWLIHDRLEGDIRLQPGDLWAISDDGSTVIGNRTLGVPYDPEPLVWRRGREPESLRTLLELAGVDAAAFTLFEEVLDISADGRTILGRGRYRYENGRQRRYQYFLAVIPEPGTALLVGLGLATLSCWRPQPR